MQLQIDAHDVGYDTRMNQLLEFAPLLIFYATYKFKDIYWATASLMVTCALLMIVHRLQTGKFKPMHVIATTLALILGTATLLFRDPRFIQWKFTVLLGLTSLAFLGSMVVGKQPLARSMLESAMEQPVEVSARTWNRLNLLWVVWFALLSFSNFYVARNYSENTWVNFKLWGITIALMLFMVPQAIWLSTKLKPSADEGTSTP
jgi:intracellular septation protein